MCHPRDSGSSWLLKWLLLSLFVASGKAQCPKPEFQGSVVLTTEDLLKNEFPEGSVATFDCAIGYQREMGLGTIFCNRGTWTYLSLKCQKKRCIPPGEILNGRFDLSAGTEYGAVIRVICNKGYETEGRSYMTCTDDGWSGMNPVCRVMMCDPPPEIENGHISMELSEESPKYGDVIEYTCNRSNTVWKIQIVCNEDGEYEPSDPTCEVQCPKPEGRSDVILLHRELLPAQVPEGFTAVFECAEGYERKWGSAIIVCINGTWTELTLTCRKKSCGFPAHVLNGAFDLSQGMEFGAVANVVCNKGYKMVGTGYLTCSTSGWSGNIPACEVVKCPEPPDIKNGRVAMKPFSKNFPEYSDKVVYSCEKGYTLVGSPVIECKENGEYVPSPPQCNTHTH
ncbi:complement factor H-like [Scleropages formosus]|uniref:Complement factor H-like n=1 Tax=Scleropages formosus TaxID=113540 RepID=A0A8C9R1P5_SCLFO|nr:complement factor H-like [Scleropages formosus]